MTTTTSYTTTKFNDMYGEPLNVNDWVVLAGEYGQGGAGLRFGKITGVGTTGNIKVLSYRRCWLSRTEFIWICGKNAASFPDPQARAWKVPFDGLPVSLKDQLMYNAEVANAK